MSENEHETAAERDRRVRGEEARMVRMEERLEAIYEFQKDERSRREEGRRALNDHMTEDEQRFTSIDSRLQGQQTQLSQINETLLDIKRSLTSDGGIEQRLRNVESVQNNWSAGWRALTAAAAVGAAIATIVGVAVRLLS